MDIHSNLEYLCRVCAANTKGKNSVAECVYILKTAGLKDKLDKFLYLKISENDSLPKVLCKSCFRQVEATASLSKIAKHTQQVFRDFLLSNLPKGPSENTNAAEFTSSDFMCSKSSAEKAKKDETPVPTNSLLQLPPPTSLSIPPLLQPLTTPSRQDEVVVNVSVADPLTRDNQQKMISNSQRRQSLLLESRFAPKIVPQKPVTTIASGPRLIAPKPTQSIESTNILNNPKFVTPTLNFYPAKAQQQTKQQQPNQTTQITTFSSGGYIIGVNTPFNDNEEQKKAKQILPLKPSADNILQQKRKNLVKALNNIKTNTTGQVSLLKSSQQKQAEAMQNIAKASLNEVFNQTTDDELPEKIIIAAPKNKSMTEKFKKEPLNLSSKMPGSTTATIAAVVQQEPEPIDALIANLPKPEFPEDILLGRVIRDMDLLKLILKALKWPVNKQNMELQLQRLRNSKFTDIMSNRNLLQDTDLTQLLGPYLAPVLLAAQALQQQQQQILNNTAVHSQPKIPLNTQPTTFAVQPKMTALEAAQAEINKSIPYKLPPETSVQLVPATPEETETTQSPPLPTLSNSIKTTASLKRDKQKETKPTAVPLKKQRKIGAQKAKDSIVISDEDDASTEGVTKKSKQRTTKSAPSIHIELNSDFMTQFSLLNGSFGGDAEELMTFLLKQKAALTKDKKVQRRRRNSVSNLMTLPPSEFDALIDLDDDIVLMEPVTTTSSLETSSSNPEQPQPQQPQQQQPQEKADISSAFVMPSVPLITRPIIKRRKTVIHTPKNRFDLSVDLKNKDVTPISSSSLLKTKEMLLEETINQVATGNISSTEASIQEKAKSNNTESVIVVPAEQSAPKPPQHKKNQNKSMLGQQLLEAIGLQKASPKIVTNRQQEAASSSTLPNDITAVPNNKQSIQKIRSALKKSLQQAQEQQQQKKKDLSSSATNTIIQDADSTTKPAVKEILVVEGKGSKGDSCSSIVDVEDQIDKVTLMVRKNEEDTCEESTAKTSSTEETSSKKELKKSTNTKIQERRRLMPSTGTRDFESCKMADVEKANEEDKQVQMIAQDEGDDIKLEKEDSVDISSSLADVRNITNESTVPTNDDVVIPKRRGRKRLIDKQIELEAAEAIEKEKANKTVATIMEKSITFDKSTEDDSEMAGSNKNDEETESNKISGRPTRQSKTQSKYYKGPEKSTQGKRSLPSRTTRNR